MKRLQFVVCVICVITATAIVYPLLERELPPPPQQTAPLTNTPEQAAPTNTPEKDQARLEHEAKLEAQAKPEDEIEPQEEVKSQPEVKSPPEYLSVEVHSPDLAPPKQDLAYLAYYAYSEVLPDTKPADTVLASLKNIPVGTPVEEVTRASDAFGLNVSFMKAVAKIESDFDPKQRTGSYIGLFQLSHYEFDRFGSGDITGPRDNAIAAAYKFATAAILFELDTHKKPTLYDLYLIHQQGWQGAAEHVAHPERIAWKSMCATDEGREKGEKWCKRAVWQNTLPSSKEVFKSVDLMTSGAFVQMWRQRVDLYYSRYSEATAAK